MSRFELCLENTCRYVSVIKSLFAGLKQKYKIFTLTCDKFPWNETKIQMTKWLYHLSSARTSVFLAVSSRMECVLTVCYRCLCCSRSRSLRRLYSSNTLWWSGPCSSEVWSQSQIALIMNEASYGNDQRFFTLRVKIVYDDSRSLRSLL